MVAGFTGMAVVRSGSEAGLTLVHNCPFLPQASVRLSPPSMKLSVSVLVAIKPGYVLC